MELFWEVKKPLKPEDTKMFKFSLVLWYGFCSVSLFVYFDILLLLLLLVI